MDIYLLLYLLFVVGPLSTILHEAGHVFAARTVNADYNLLSIGIGKKIYGKSFHTFQLSIHRLFFLGGFSASYRKRTFNSREKIWISLMGPFTSALLAFVFYFFHLIYPNNYFLLFSLFNCWLAIVNLLPLNIGGKQSDGYKIVQILRKRK